MLCRCQIRLHECQEVCAGTTLASSRGNTGDQTAFPGSSAGTDHPVLVGTALGTSCILLNGKACLSERISNKSRVRLGSVCMRIVLICRKSSPLITLN